MTENSPANRVPAGVPTGGQFAASAHAESQVVLVAQHGDGHLALTNDGRAVPGHTCPGCGNGYASQAGLDAHPCEGDTDGASALPPAPLTPRDVEHLVENRGVFEHGYDEDDVSRVLGNFEGARLMCVWDNHDDLGYGGDSEFVGRAVGSAATGTYGEGRRVTVSVGPWRRIHPQVWEYLSESDSDLDPESIPSLLADEPYERQDLDDLPGDGHANVAFEADEDLCTHCGDPTDDGEGYDGYCGTCADKIANHESGVHDPEQRGHVDPDCPECDQREVRLDAQADALRKDERA